MARIMQCFSVKNKTRVTHRVLDEREVAEHVLVGHLYAVRALRADALHRAAHVHHALRRQPQRADVQRQERACHRDT